jgi:hypothetical protein
MTADELATASDLLDSAAEDASDPDSVETLTDLSDQLERLASAERGPDHGRLARIEAKLDDVQAAESDAVATTIESALEEIHAYRETIEGV